jgi:hypothetical protein
MKRLSVRTLTLLAGLFVPCAGTASAQTPTLPVRIAGPCALPAVMRSDPDQAEKAMAPVAPTAALTRSFQSGQWIQFKADVDEILQRLGERADLTPECTAARPDADFLLVTWVGATPLGEPALLTAVVGAGRREPYAWRLPGVVGAKGRFYQVFVSDEKADALAAGFLSTPVENPLLAQVPDVADTVLGPMLSLLSANMSRELRGKPPAAKAHGEESPPPAAGWVTVSRVDLPHERATVKVQMKVALAPTAGGLTNASVRLRDKLSMVDVRYSRRARDFAAALHAIVEENAGACVAPGASCLSVLDPEFSSKYDTTCPCPDEDRKAVQLVDGRFRALAADVEGQALTAKAEIKNVPLERHSFGLMAGFSFLRTSSGPAATVDDGAYAHDPVDRQLVMVTFNTAFRAYDSHAFRMTRPERHRWFLGAVIAPAFGVGAGYSWLPTRRLGISVGYAALGISTPAGGKAIGEAPGDDDDPFEFGWAGTAFLGTGYTFK